MLRENALEYRAHFRVPKWQVTGQRSAQEQRQGKLVIELWTKRLGRPKVDDLVLIGLSVHGGEYCLIMNEHAVQADVQVADALLAGGIQRTAYFERQLTPAGTSVGRFVAARRRGLRRKGSSIAT